jgi:hypothetical protein
MQTHRKIDERSLAMMKAVAKKIDDDPQQNSLKKAREVCDRWAEMHDNPYIHKWRELLKSPWKEIKSILLTDSEQASAMRQGNPFGGILTPKEWWQIYREFRDR